MNSEWATSFAPTSGSAINIYAAIATDSNSNVYTIGHFIGGDMTIGDTTLINDSNHNDV